MLPQYEVDFNSYKNKIMQLVPILGQLAEITNIIWLSQYPTTEFFGKNEAYNSLVYSEKIYFYNNAVTSAFKWVKLK